MNIETQRDRHIGNISRLIGHDVSGKYSYIVSESDLINAYLQMRNDLGYPLMLESRYRRAIVYNKQGLEQQIQSMIANCINESSKDLTDVVVADIINQLNYSLSGNKTSGNSTNVGALAGNIFGKGLVKGISNIIDDITDTERYKRR